jgi:hypothetical protein
MLLVYGAFFTSAAAATEEIRLNSRWYELIIKQYTLRTFSTTSFIHIQSLVTMHDYVSAFCVTVFFLIEADINLLLATKVTRNHYGNY